MVHRRCVRGDAALDRLVTRGHSPASGARFLKRMIDDVIKLPISERWHAAPQFNVVLRDGEVAVEASTPDLLDAHADALDVA